ncbi:MAG: UpxY family transcription antiterminator [Thermodesulfobacteriota bacterium]
MNSSLSAFEPLNLLTSSLEPHWYALFTRSRHEKFIYLELEKRRIESFLPIRFLKRKWSDRTVTVEEPLFKSYLFVKTNILGFSDVLKTKGAVKLVSAGANPIPIGENVIASLRNVIQPEIVLDPFPYLRSGDRVYVKSGIFKGTEGFIVRKNDKKCRLVISIEAIMASVSVEVDSCLVERI